MKYHPGLFWKLGKIFQYVLLKSYYSLIMLGLVMPCFENNVDPYQPASQKVTDQNQLLTNLPLVSSAAGGIGALRVKHANMYF